MAVIRPFQPSTAARNPPAGTFAAFAAYVTFEAEINSKMEIKSHSAKGKTLANAVWTLSLQLWEASPAILLEN